MKVNPDYRQNLRPLIVMEAMRCFRERGIKAVRMDDISNGLHISKRTLYELYVNKEELLLDVLKLVYKTREENLQKVASENDVMDVLLEVLRMEVDSTVNTNQNFFADIQKYPSALELLKGFYEEQRKGALKFFESGVNEGYFLGGIDYGVFMKITATIMDSLKVYTRNEQMSMLEVLNNYVLVLMRGMCTQKGISRIDEFVNKL